MGNNKHNVGSDRKRVAGGQEWEVSYMARKMNVSEQQVEEAIQKVGVSREKVEDYLRKK